MYTLTSRDATPQELADIHRHAHASVGSFLSVSFLFGVLPVLILQYLGAWVAMRVNQGATLVGRILGGVMGGGIFLWAVNDMRRAERRHHDEAVLDEVDHQVEVLTVYNPRVLLLASRADSDPVLAIDIGDNQVLLLQGSWLHDPQTYGTHDHGDCDANVAILNGLPHPYSFPASQFTITRMPHSGDVLKIEVEGGYVKPIQTVGALPATYNFRDSEIFDGSLDDLPHVLHEEHRRRCPEYRRAPAEMPALLLNR
ncbi:MAG TPA: hypothetical protein VH253_09245 [Phycisphaerae bacterium]|nr:hypothetical protein [Phycisphaerae bacterium]